MNVLQRFVDGVQKAARQGWPDVFGDNLPRPDQEISKERTRQKAGFGVASRDRLRSKLALGDRLEDESGGPLRSRYSALEETEKKRREKMRDKLY